MVDARLGQDRRDHSPTRRDLSEQPFPVSRPLFVTQRRCFSPRATDEPRSEQVHVDGESRRAIPTSEPVDSDYVVVHGLDTEPTELPWDRRAHHPAALECLDVFDREATVSIVLIRPGHEVPCVHLGEGNKLNARLAEGL
jgi:hypothetical protein